MLALRVNNVWDDRGGDGQAGRDAWSKDARKISKAVRRADEQDARRDQYVERCIKQKK